MVNPDSDLARAHPDWILATGGRLPPPSRLQQVLDLGTPGGVRVPPRAARRAARPSTRIDYLKWDHNRDLVDGRPQPGGEAGGAPQTAGRSTGCSTSSGAGTRGWRSSPARPAAAAGSTSAILERTDRVWTSDCNDAARTPADPALDRAAAAAGAARRARRRRARAHHRPHAHRSTSGPAPRCSATSASSWDLTAMSADELAELGRVGRPRTSGCGRCCTPGRSCAATTPTRRCGCTASWRRTAARRCSPLVAMQTGADAAAGTGAAAGAGPGPHLPVSAPGPRSPAHADPGAATVGRRGGTGVVRACCCPGGSCRQHGIQAPQLNPATLVLLHLEAV